METITDCQSECFYCPVAAGCAWCFPAGTKIKTPTGWRNIEELKIGDLVIDQNGNSQPIIRTTSHIADDIVNIQATGLVSITTTSEHPFWVQPVEYYKNNLPVRGTPRWVKAKDIQLSDRIGLYTPDLTKGVNINPTIAYLLGRYIGDGWKTDSKRVQHPFRYYLCCSYDEEEELDHHLQSGPIYYTKTYNKTIVEYNIPITGSLNSILTDLFDECGRYARDKKVPSTVWSWSSDSVTKLLEGYFDADGCIDSSLEVQRFTSISYELILGISELVRAVYHKNVNITYNKKDPIGYIQGRQINQSDSYEGRFLLRTPKRQYYTFDENNNIMWVNAKRAINRGFLKKEVF